MTCLYQQHDACNSDLDYIPFISHLESEITMNDIFCIKKNRVNHRYYPPHSPHFILQMQNAIIYKWDVISFDIKMPRPCVQRFDLWRSYRLAYTTIELIIIPLIHHCRHLLYIPIYHMQLTTLNGFVVTLRYKVILFRILYAQINMSPMLPI